MQQARLPEYLWDLIKWNDEAIVADAVHLENRRSCRWPGLIT